MRVDEGDAGGFVETMKDNEGDHQGACDTNDGSLARYEWIPRTHSETK